MTPLDLHKALQRETESVITVKCFAKQWNIQVDDIRSSMEVLAELQLAETDATQNFIRLTDTGKWANLG